MRVDLTLVLDRSWRIGSGQAAGRHLDDLVRCDEYGFPFIPGSTLRGLVADALRRLALALDVGVCDGTLTRSQGQPLGQLCGVTRQGTCPLCVLTGSNHREAAVAFEPARLLLGRNGERLFDPEDRRRLGDLAASVPGLLTRHRTRTAIDEQSGRADDEHLFALEEAVAGLELSATLRIERSAPDLSSHHLALLVAALRFVREVGGGRRRGLGSCRVRIDDADLAPAFGSWQEAVRSLEGEPASAEVPPRLGPGGTETRRAQVAPHAREVPAFLALDAVVVGELALGGRPEAGNLVPGLPFVPGSTLRGALAARWQGDRAAEEFQRIFLSGSVRFGYLYPRSGQAAARPMSLARHTCKLRPGEVPRGHGFVDLLLEPEAARCPMEGCGGRLVPWSPAFEGASGDAAERLVVSPHNRIDFERQTVPEGGLFAYEVLPEGRRLRGYLRADGAEEMAVLLGGLGLAVGDAFRLRVGRRKGVLGYLECRLLPYDGLDGGVGLFPDAGTVPGRWPEGEAVRVDLLTPAVVTDAFLRYRDSLAPEDLGLARERFDGAFARSQRVAGWNRAHRLPKGDEVAVQAGSSYLLRRPPSGAEEELLTLTEAASRGIGSRRTEGFGVVSITAVVEPGPRGEGREEGS